MGIYQQENLIAIFLCQINLYEQVSTKINTFRNFRIYKGGLPPPPKVEEVFKKFKQNGGFSLFFCFLARLPKSPKL